MPTVLRDLWFYYLSSLCCAFGFL